MPRLLLLSVLVALLGAPAVVAQSDPTGPAAAGGPGAPSSAATTSSHAIAGEVVSGVTHVDAGALAAALGDVVTAAGGVLTWSGTEGVATFFLGSADALMQRPQDGGADEWALSAPPLLRSPGTPTNPSDWLLPIDAVQLLGVAASVLGDRVFVHLPDGSMLAVATQPEHPAHEPSLSDMALGSSEVTTVAGVPALRFFVEDALSLLLLDLDLAPLAFPELTTVIDQATARAGGDQALLALVTSLARLEWSTSLVFAQDDLTVEVRSPYRFHLYLGDEATVSPEAPVAGVILLPPAFSLYKPIAVSWAGRTATVTFRH